MLKLLKEKGMLQGKLQENQRANRQQKYCKNPERQLAAANRARYEEDPESKGGSESKRYREDSDSVAGYQAAQY